MKTIQQLYEESEFNTEKIETYLQDFFDGKIANVHGRTLCAIVNMNGTIATLNEILKFYKITIETLREQNKPIEQAVKEVTKRHKAAFECYRNEQKLLDDKIKERDLMIERLQNELKEKTKCYKVLDAEYDLLKEACKELENKLAAVTEKSTATEKDG